MAFCRKICCCDWSEDRNKLPKDDQGVEMQNGTTTSQYSPTPNYGRDQRASSLMSNGSSNPSNNNSPRGLQDPLMSPGSTNILNNSSGGDDLPMSPLVLNHNASFAVKPSGLNSPSGAVGPTTPGGSSKKRVTLAAKGYEQPKHLTTSLQGNGQLKGIYRHKSSYGPDSQSMMQQQQFQQLDSSGKLATQQVLGSPYAGADATGGREPPDLSLL